MKNIVSIFLFLSTTLLLSQNINVNLRISKEKIEASLNSQTEDLSHCTIQILDSNKTIIKTEPFPKPKGKDMIKQYTETVLALHDLNKGNYTCLIYSEKKEIYKKEFYKEAFLSKPNSGLKKVLIVATNIGTVGGNTSGTFLVEIVYPFKYFIDKGYDVDITTPKGGTVALYDNGMVNEYMKRVQKSDYFISKTKNSLSPNDVIDSNYVAVYYPGGHGQYFDVVNNEGICAHAAKIYERNGVIGTAGHGAASLINIKLSNKKYLVDGKKLTCFPTWGEKEFMTVSNYGRSIPFDMEEVLKKHGADLTVCAKGSKKEFCNVVDDKNRLVTGSRADDALWVAEQMLKLVEKK